MSIKASRHQTTDQVAGKAHEAVDSAAQTAGKAEEYARDRASNADQRIREAAAHGREHAEDARDRVNTYVHEHPVMSIGIAFIVGLLCSWLMGRR